VGFVQGGDRLAGGFAEGFPARLPGVFVIVTRGGGDVQHQVAGIAYGHDPFF
jgi:hypothetical protein